MYECGVQHSEWVEGTRMMSGGWIFARSHMSRATARGSMTSCRTQKHETRSASDRSGREVRLGGCRLAAGLRVGHGSVASARAYAEPLPSIPHPLRTYSLSDAAVDSVLRITFLDVGRRMPFSSSCPVAGSSPGFPPFDAVFSLY